MAVTLTRNLKLRLDSSLTASARYNLERLDLLGSTFLVDTTDALRIRSTEDIVIEPQSADIGGSGTGGSVSIGSADHSVDSISMHASSITMSSSPGFLDQSSGGTKHLYMQYKSDLSGSVDTAADRTLSIDLDGSNRSLVLGGDLSLTGGSLTLVLSGDLNWALPSGNGSNGQVLGTDGAGNLDWVSVSGTGTVTSVGLSLPSLFSVSGSPVTTSGTLTASLATQSANRVLAGPTSGGAAAPTFRALVASDISNIAGYRSDSVTWNNADGNSLTITHGWGTFNVEVEVLDNSNSYATIDVGDINRINVNQITLTASSAPSSSWTVLLKEAL